MAGATALVVAFVPPVRDEFEWQLAAAGDTERDYAEYVREWPDGRHAEEGLRRWDERSWEAAHELDSVEGFEGYLAVHDEGRHAAEATERLDDLRWQQARDENSFPAFDGYLADFPEGRHAGEAHAAKELLAWRNVQGSVEGLEEYLERYPDGTYAEAARTGIDDLHWQDAQGEDTVLAYLRYVALPGKGRFEADARRRVAALRRSDEPFRAAERIGSREAWDAFLRQFQGHRRTAEARARIVELRGVNIVDLIAAGKVEVQAQGRDITQVALRVRRTVNRTLSVKIEVGTYFQARGSFQNMVATRDIEIELDSNEWEDVSVDAACANRTRAIPGEGDGFTLARSSHQVELKRVVAQVEDEEFAVRQAAVWIITDNASFADLGILVSPSSPRIIEADHAARAMQLVEKAGIPITGKAIWRDFDIIRLLVTRDELRRWLDNRKKRAS